jgi:uncharacterized membrane protein
VSYAAKAWIALIGSIVTALLGLEVIPTVGVWHTILTITSAVVTAVATYQVPNTPRGVLP